MLSALAQLLAPPVCAGCAAPGTAWCRQCAAVVPEPRCTQVGIPVYSTYAFAGPVRRTIIDWKDEGRTDARRRVVSWLREGIHPLLEASPDAVLVAVPPSPRSLRRRGCGVLVEAVRRAAPGVPVEPWLIAARTRQDQVGLGAAARDRNLHESMRWIGPCDRRIIVVDDVLTTGATLRECARAMRRGGVPYALASTIAHREQRAPVAEPAAGLRLSWNDDMGGFRGYQQPRTGA